MKIVLLSLLVFLTLFAPARAADQTWHCMQPAAVAGYELPTDGLALADIKLAG
jgi:hypothetical protein